MEAIIQGVGFRASKGCDVYMAESLGLRVLDLSLTLGFRV